MPELARFYGISIRMFVERGGKHHLPHFHVYYQDEVACFTIDPVEPLRGQLPTRQRRLVEAWAELHISYSIIGNCYKMTSLVSKLHHYDREDE